MRVRGAAALRGHGELKGRGGYRNGVDVIAFVIGVVLLVVGLAVSIALHELGHLLPAKKFGVRVGQYMIGFGPTLWSRRRGETEYGFKAIPLGGYISMAGMYPPSPTLRRKNGTVGTGHRTGRAGGGFFATMVQDARTANDETLLSEDDDRVFYRLPVWQRVVIMLGGPVMNLLLAIVLFAILLSGIGVQTATTTVQSVSECVIPVGSHPHDVRGIRSGRSGEGRRARGRGRHPLGRRHRREHVRGSVGDHPQVARSHCHRGRRA